MAFIEIFHGNPLLLLGLARIFVALLLGLLAELRKWVALFAQNSPSPTPVSPGSRGRLVKKYPTLKGLAVHIFLHEATDTLPTGTHVDVLLTEYGNLTTETVREIVQAGGGSLVLEDVPLGLLVQPWFWPVVLAGGASEVHAVLAEGESLGQVEDTLKRITWTAQEFTSDIRTTFE